MTACFTVITPCYNAERWIADTVLSVIGQSVFADGQARLQYIVVDGGSTDATVERVRSLVTGRDDVEIISEPDRGMYEALAKGLARARGDFCSYLNAGDVYHAHAFSVVAAVLGTGLAQWITGFQATANEAGEITDVRIPYRYRRAFFECGFYGTRLPVVQQESTFWLSSLNSLVDLERLAAFRLAGDFYLWRSFAAEHDLQVVAALLAGFRKVRGQLSQDAAGYRRELLGLSRPASLSERLLARHDAARFRWLRTGRRRHPGHIVFDHRTGEWG